MDLNLDLKGKFGRVDAVVGVWDHSLPECTIEVEVLLDNVTQYHKTLRWGQVGRLHISASGHDLLQFVAVRTPILPEPGPDCEAAVGQVFGNS